jgi:hypothetical protein
MFLKELLENNFRLTVYFKNLTSETSIPEAMTIISLFSNGCSIELPVKSCSQGHQTRLHFVLENDRIPKDQRKKIEVIGKVIELTPTNEKVSEVKVQFNQFIKEEWEALLDVLEAKQEEISSIVHKMKTI